MKIQCAVMFAAPLLLLLTLGTVVPTNAKASWGQDQWSYQRVFSYPETGQANPSCRVICLTKVVQAMTRQMIHRIEHEQEFMATLPIASHLRNGFKKILCIVLLDDGFRDKVGRRK
jgi:hypothetical protein